MLYLFNTIMRWNHLLFTTATATMSATATATVCY